MTDGRSIEQEHREKALTLAREARFAMVTVHDGARLVSRPMTPQEVTEDADVWFLMEATGEQADQVRADPQVNVAFSGSSSWLSISGAAELVVDRERVRELWSPAAEAWFPEGPDEPRLGLLHVRGGSAEYWDTPGGRIASALSFVKAKVTGETLDAENETVDLR